VDTAQRGGEPGTVYVIEPELATGATATAGAGGTAEASEAGEATGIGGSTGTPASDGPGLLAQMSLFNAHGMQPDLVLSLAGTLGADAGRVLVVGCEPATLEEGIGLSAPVAAAVDEAVRIVTGLVTPGLDSNPDTMKR